MIGLKRNIVKLEKHNPLWKKEFEKEEEILLKILGKEVLAIHHIGSTAIPGIHAKPIIDIAVEVSDFKVLDLLDDKLKENGIIHRPMHDDPEKRLYVKGGDDYRTHHIHFYEKDSALLKNNLFFRDHLIKNPEIAQKYNRFKIELAKRYANNRKGYTENKKQIVEEILKDKTI